MEMPYTEEMTFLHQLGCQAGAELMRFFAKGVRVRQKADRSLVTDADLASEKLIIETLRNRFPADTIYSEEAGLSSSERKPGGRIWIVDPLDGTTNFSNNYPFFCVSIARAEFTPSGGLKVMSGVVHEPVRNRTYVVERGRGAWVNQKQIFVTSARPPEDAFLVTGFAYHRGDNLRRDIEFFMSVAETCQSIRRDGAAALDLAMVAEGIYDGYWETGIKPWDLAAGILLVEEAGGVLKNYPGSAGEDFDIEAGNVICGTSPVVNFITGLL